MAIGTPLRDPSNSFLFEMDFAALCLGAIIGPNVSQDFAAGVYKWHGRNQAFLDNSESFLFERIQSRV